MKQAIKKENCAHVSEMKVVSTDKTVCEAILPDGQVCGEKENLRLCTYCGKVFCCESHKAHNLEHFEKTRHPIIVPLPTGTPLTWTWCYIDNAYLE